MNCPPIEKVRSVAQSVGILHPTGTIKYEYEYVDYYEYRYHRQLRNIFVGTLDNCMALRRNSIGLKRKNRYD